ncbi:uncharacterized protein LOC134263089 [Saccostrea cucullata]|uniref:uncharacterized protein LOC134263089 n=1 Tax=Saccostrea cuccullata TaxID=36930 RepID=UPI002ED324F5
MGSSGYVQIVSVRPSEICFAHDSIQSYFSDGRSLEETFRELLWEEISVESLPMIEIMQNNSYWSPRWFVVRGNRRLFLYQKLEELGRLKYVKVIRRSYDEATFKRQVTTVNMGKSVRTRGSYLDQRLGEIWKEYKREKGYCTIS